MIDWKARRYIEDPYRSEFDGEIVERLEWNGRPALVLSETFFYPESGGQPNDLGTIQGIRVTDVQERASDGAVVHVVDSLPERDRVECRIDWPRRLDHMQQHSGQHMLSAAFLKEHEAQTLSFHLGAEHSTIDLDRELTHGDCITTENRVNAVIQSATAVSTRFVEDASELELRKKAPEAELLRIVAIEGFDQQACCGTHPKNASEVGVVLVRSVEGYKSGSRVSFVCGERARADYRLAVKRVRAASGALSSSEADLASAVARVMDERKTTGKRINALQQELIQFQAEAWLENATEHEGCHLLVRSFSDGSIADAGLLRAAASHLVASPSRIVLLGAVAGGKAHVVFARAKDQSADMGSLMKEVLPALDGKGGGSSQIAQGGGPNAAGLEQALERARTLVIENLAGS